MNGPRRCAGGRSAFEEGPIRIDIEGDDDRGGWFFTYVGAEALPFMTIYTGPFPSRPDAERAIPEYVRSIQRELNFGK